MMINIPTYHIRRISIINIVKKVKKHKYVHVNKIFPKKK